MTHRDVIDNWCHRYEMTYTLHLDAVDDLIASATAVIALGILVRHPPPRIMRNAGVDGHAPTVRGEPRRHASVVEGDAGGFRGIIVGQDRQVWSAIR